MNVERTEQVDADVPEDLKTTRTGFPDPSVGKWSEIVLSCPDVTFAADVALVKDLVGVKTWPVDPEPSSELRGQSSSTARVFDYALVVVSNDGIGGGRVLGQDDVGPFVVLHLLDEVETA